ncbi:uncharacterized protein LOC134680034 [Cydia fagiglandana]|uniref:uncharacterized protein LOC134680034 n=1 Tax=Cydia fagiglandana TaxID=1458189 RepID=UPI002FEE46B4
MAEDDPPDPGGENLQVGINVEIESSMDTDTSVNNKNDLKRKVYKNKRCKDCNKKRKRNSGGEYVCECEIVQKTQVHTITNTDTNKVVSDIQTTKVGRNLFSTSDVAPFTVHVQLKQTDPNSSLHPVSFGRFLVKNGFKNIINGSVKRIGRTRISMAFANHIDANLFVTNPQLDKENLTAYIPSFTVTRMGLVRGIPSQWTEEEIVSNISVPIGCGKVLKVRRLNHRVTVNGTVSWQPSETVVLTFDGQVLPKRVFSCYNSLPVELYIFPTIQCYNCTKFGHTKTNCRSRPKCFKCGQLHPGHTCSVEEDDATCCLCNGFHFATNRACPEHKRQKDIKVTMANNCISYAEAVKLHPAVSKSFADVLLTQSSPQSQSPQSQPNLHRSVHNPAPSRIMQSHSYKKTTFLKPRTVKKLITTGYDVAAHNALVKEYTIPSPQNGCALQQESVKDNVSVAEEIQALINHLSQPNVRIPSHVAPMLEELVSTIKNNGQNYTMELQKCNK